MKKRTILTTVIAFLLLAAVIAAGMNAVFTVTYVNARFVTYTEEGERAAQELKEELNGYLGRSTTFLDLEEVRATAQAYPRFMVVSVEKQYPASVVVEVRERRAAFALPGADGYDIFDGEGVRIGSSASADGYILLAGDFSFSAANGALAGTYSEQLLAMYAAFAGLLGEPRANVLSVSLQDNSSTGTLAFDRFRIAMREGVEIVILEPSVRIEDKARAAVQCYLALDEGDRVRGTINVVEQNTGTVVANWSSSSAAA